MIKIIPKVIKILLAEDDESTANLIIHALEKYNIKVTHVSDGMAALTKTKNFTFDLVISDINMPYLDGLGFIDKSKEFLKNTPVILLTADGEKGTVTKAAHKRIDAYILKPIAFQFLIEKTKSLLVLDDTSLVEKKNFPISVSLKENTFIEIGMKIQGCVSKRESDIIYSRFAHFLSGRDSFTALRIVIEDTFFLDGDAFSCLNDFISKVTKNSKIRPDSIWFDCAYLRDHIHDFSTFNNLKVANFIS